MKLLRLVLMTLLMSTLSLHASASEGVTAALQASANVQVLQDEVRLVFAHEAQGKTAAEVNRALTQALEQARGAVSVPAGVSMSSGSFRTSPSYNKDGRPDGWRGRAELVLQSTDFAATEKVAGLLGTQLALASVNFSLSPEKRRITEQTLLKEVAQTFRNKATSAASAFGFDRYKIMSLDFGGQNNVGNAPMLMRSAAASGDQASDPVRFSLDPSLVQVSISVSGKVRFD
ncbi:SIMPL domain-containing protein [Zwartia sp.]|uniref:SIMPL domain-containing protein n=1 Tax=Zwartia sp. TaxID=2978004 RepID=UPI002723EE7D|nr:SIMPL domain-containing protein [Zwartia sp.]MDO9023301.1 SIMPL domain-containing protein [Zwartia sp.]